MRVMPRRSFRGAATVLALATAALIGTAGIASACWSDDNRPRPIPGKPTPCAQDQNELKQSDVEFTGGEGKGRLSITSVHEGVTVNRIVVPGGNDGFNDYAPGKKGLSQAAPWNDLRAPMNYNGSKADIDKWFLCGTKEKTKPPTTTTTTKPSTPTSAKPTETTSAPSTSSTTPAAPAGNESGGSGGGLANTGFDNGWLIGVAALLLLGGGGLLVLLRIRRKASE